MRRPLAVVLFAGILFGGLRPDLLRLPFSDRSSLGRELRAAADSSMPGYSRFLEEVRKSIRPGETILVLVPPGRWRNDVPYPEYRARYILSDRSLVSVVNPGAPLLGRKLAQALYVAAWGVDFRDPGFSRVWAGAGGELRRRIP